LCAYSFPFSVHRARHAAEDKQNYAATSGCSGDGDICNDRAIPSFLIFLGIFSSSVEAVNAVVGI